MLHASILSGHQNSDRFRFMPDFFYVDESLTRQYPVNNGRHIPPLFANNWLHRCVNEHLSMSIIFILTEELAASKRLSSHSSIRRAAIRLRQGMGSSSSGRVRCVSHLLDRLNPRCFINRENHGKLEVPKVYQNGGCRSPRTMANKINNIRLKWTCLETYEGSSTRASRVSEAIGTLDSAQNYEYMQPTR